MAEEENSGDAQVIPIDPSKAKSITYDLVWPVSFGTETITRLIVRRPKFKDLAAARQGMTLADTGVLIGKLTGQPRPVIDELDADDLQALSEIIRGFSRRSPSTGDEPSPS